MSRDVLAPAALLTLLGRAPAGIAVSGSELAARCGVTRAAIWKQIDALRSLGAPITAAAGAGYRLERPIELLTVEQIRAAAGPWVETLDIEVLWRCDSTNSVLLRKAATDPRSGLACLAEIQTAGRGRRGRAWQMPLASGLALSLLWRFEVGMASLSGLSLVAGVAIMRALEDLDIHGCGLKWPNDVIANDAKLAGTLVELGGDMLGPCHAVIGIGINVQREPISKGAGRSAIDQAWTDLAQICTSNVPGCGIPGRNRLAGRMLTRLVEALELFAKRGFVAFMNAFARYDVLVGREVRLLAAAGTREARVLGVDKRGCLRLHDGSGEFVVTSGEISVRAARDGGQ